MVLIITFIVTLIVGVPICYVLGLVGAAGLISMGPTYFPLSRRSCSLRPTITALWQSRCLSCR